jgi:tetratricopeptide (TPR) repeat protein
VAPEEQKSSSNPLGFGLEFRRGSTLVTLEHRPLPGGLLIDRLELEVPEVSFPFDVLGGAEQFRHRRCRLRALSLSMAGAELAAWLERLSEDGRLGLAELRLELEQGEGWLGGRLSSGSQAATFSARFAAEPGEDLELRIGFHDLRLFGPLPVPASVLVSRLARMWKPWRVTQPSAGWLALRPVQDLLRRVLPYHGWKVPELAGLRLDRVWLRAGRLGLACARFPDELPEALDDPLVRRVQRSYLVFREGAELFAAAEKALRDGRLLEARTGYLGPGEVQPAHPLAARRLMEIGLAEPERADAVEDLIRDRLVQAPEDVHAWLARAALLEAHKPAEAGRAYARAAELCEERAERADAVRALFRAGELLSDADRPQAIATLERLVALEADHHPALGLLAELYVAQGQWYRALRMLHRLARGARFPAAAAAHHARMGLIHLERLGDLEQARRHLDAALAADPGNLEALVAMADVQQRRGQPERAARLLAEVLERIEAVGPAEASPASPTEPARVTDTRLRLARLWEESLGDRAVALSHYTHILRSEPDHLEALFRAGRLAMDGDQPELADDLWSRLVDLQARGAALSPEAVREACLGLGRIHASRPDGLEEARRHVKRAVELDPRDLEAWQALEAIERSREAFGPLIEALEAQAVLETEPARALAAWLEAARVAEHELDDRARAEAFLRRALQLEPGSDEVLERLGELLQRQKRFAELDDLWQGSIRAELAPPVAAVRWARVGELRLAHLGDLNGGLQAIELAVRLDRTNRRLVERLLDLLRQHGRTEHWVEVVERLAPDVFEPAARVDLFLEQARLLAARPGQAARAIAAYRRALAEDPDLLEAHRALTDLFVEVEDWASVRAAVNRVLELAGEGGLSGPGLTEMHRRLALAEQALGDHEAAINHLRVVLHRFPDDEDAAGRLAQLLRARERWSDLAGLYAERASRADGEQAAALHAAAASIWWEKLGLLAEAGAQLSLAVEASPDSQATPARLASLQRLAGEQGRWDQVAAVLRRRIELAASPERAPLWMALGTVLEAELEDANGAERCWVEALEADPAHLPALVRLVEHRLASGQHAEALALAERAGALPLEGRPLEQRAALALCGARAAWALKKNAEACRFYQAHLEVFAQRSLADAHPEAFERLELLLREARDFEPLALLYQRWLQAGHLPERHAGIRRALALLMFEHLDQPTQGLELLSEHVREHPEDALAVSGLAHLLRQSQRWRELANLWEEHWERTPQAAERLRRLEELAEILESRLFEPAAASLRFRQLLDLGHEPAWERLRALYGREGRHAELAELLTARAARLAAEEAGPLWSAVGRLAAGPLQDDERALAAHLRAHQASPGPESRQAVLEVLARLEPAGRRAPRRLDFLRKEFEAEEESAESCRLALLVADALLAEQPEREARVEALSALRRALDRSGAPEVAARVLELAEELRDWPAAALALEALTDAAPDGPQAARRLTELGRLYEERLDSAERAEAAFAEAARRDPEARVALERLADLRARHGRPAEAAEALEAALALGPGLEAEALRRLAALRLAAGQDERAAEALRRLLEAEPADAPGRRDLERLLASLGRSAELAELIEAGLSCAVDPVEVVERWLEAALAWRDAGEGRRARSALEAAVTAAPDTVALDARLERLGEEQPGWPELWRLMAARFAAARRPDREAEALRRLAGCVQGEERLHALRRVARLSWDALAGSMGRPVGGWSGAVPTAVRPTVQRVRADLQRLADLQVDDPETQDRLLVLDRLEHRHAELADRLAARARSADSPIRLAALLRERAEVLMLHLDREAEAVPVLEQLTGLLPAEREAWQHLRRLYLAGGRPAQAAGAIQRLIELSTEDGERAALWMELGRLSDGLPGASVAALDAWRQAASLAPAHPEPLRRLRELAIRLDDPGLLAEALEGLAGQGSVPAEQAEFHRGAGLLYWRLGRPADARRNFERLLVLDADDLTAHRFLARILGPGDAPSALPHLDWLERHARSLLPHDARTVRAELERGLLLALERDPSDRAAYARLEPLWAERPEADRGGLLLRWAESPAAGGERAALYARAAGLFEAAGDAERAERAWLRLNALAPDHPEAFERLRTLLSAREAWEDWLELVERRRAAEPSSERAAALAFEAGGLLARLGRDDEADELFGACLELEPAHRLCLEALADLRERAGRVEDAARLLERLLPLVEEAERASLALRRARMGERLGELEARIRFYREALEATPDDRVTLVALVRALDESGRAEEACEALARLAVTDLDPFLEELRAGLRSELVRAELLRIMAERAEESQRPGLWRERADLLERAGAGSEAAEALERALESPGPHRLETALQAARLARRLGDRARVEVSLRVALEVDPDSPAALEELAAALEEAGEWARAAQVVQRLVAARAMGEGDLPAREAEHLLRLGGLWRRAGEVAEARQAYQRAVARDPVCTPAYQALEALWREALEADGVQAREADRQLAELYQAWAGGPAVGEERAARFRQAAEHWMRAGLTEEAAQALSLAIRVDPTGIGSHVLLAPLLRQSNRFEELASLLGQWFGREPDPARRAELAFELAQINLDRLDDPGAAAAQLERCLQLDPDHVGALLLLADLRFADERWQEAGALYERLSGRVPRQREREVRVRQGRIAERLGDLDGAARLFAAAAEQGDTDAAAHRSLVRVLTRAGRVPEALAAITELIARVPEAEVVDAALAQLEQQVERPEVRAALLGELAGRAGPEQAVGLWMQQAEILLRTEAPARAAAAMQRSLEIPGPHRFEQALRLAELQDEVLHDERAAAESLAFALAHRPVDTTDTDWAGLLSHLADLQQNVGALEALVETLERLLAAAEPGRRAGLALRLADAYARLGLPEQAVEAAERALELDASSALAWERLVELQRGRLSKVALAALVERWAGGPAAGGRRAELWLESAALRREAGEVEAALAALERAVEAEPGSLPGWRGLAELGAGREPLSAWLLALQRCFELEPEARPRAGWAFVLGQVAEQRQKDPDAAAVYYARCLEFEPDHPDALERAASLALAAGRDEAAEVLLARLESVAPDRPGLASARADIAERLGRETEALELWRRSARLEPGRPEPGLRLARCLARAGDMDAARSELERGLGLCQEQSGGSSLADALAELPQSSRPSSQDEGWRRLVADFLVERHPAQAASWLERQVGRLASAERDEFVLRLGDARLATGRVDLAREAWTKVLAEQPGREDVWRRLEGLWEDGDPEDVRAAFYQRWAEALPAGARQAELLRLAATLLARAGRHAEALAVLERALSVAPDEPETWADLAPRLAEVGRHAEQVEWLERLGERAETPGEGAALLAEAAAIRWERLGQSEAARRLATRALELEPEHALAVEVLADLCWQEGQDEDAARLYVRLGELARPARQAEVMLRRGLLASRAEQFEAAADWLGRAVQAAGADSPWAEQAAGVWIRALDRLERVELAVAAVDEALLPRLSPRAAAGALAILRADVRSPGLQAHLLLRQAEREEAEEAPGLWLERAAMLEGLGDTAHAAEALRRGLALPGPHRSEAARRLVALPGHEVATLVALEAALAEAPADLDLSVCVAVALERAGDHARIADLLEPLAGDAEAQARGDLALLLGRAQAALGRAEEARSNLERALEHAPGSEEAFAALVDLLESRELADLWARWADSPAGQTRQAELLRRAVEQFVALGDFERAEALLGRLAGLEPDALSNLALRVELLRRAGRWAELSSMLGQWRARAPDEATRARLAREMGDLARLHLGNPGAAAAHYTACLGLMPDDPGALFGLATIRQLQQRDEDAEPLWLRLAEVAQGAERAAALLELARLSTLRGDEAEVERRLEGALAAAPGAVGPHRARLERLLARGEETSAQGALAAMLARVESGPALDEALEQLLAAAGPAEFRAQLLAALAERRPERLTPEAWSQHAAACLAEGRSDQALEALGRAVQAQGPGRTAAARSLADLRRQVGRPVAEVIEALEAVREAEPEDTAVWLELTGLYEQTQQWQRAEACLAALIDRVPVGERSALALRLGDARGQRQAREETLSAYERALELDPGNAEAYARLETLLAAGSSPAELADLYLRWARGPAGEGRRAELWWRAARFLQEAWDEPGAVEALRGVLAEEPDRLEAHAALCELLGKLQRPVELEAALSAWSARETESSRLAEIATRRGELAEALAAAGDKPGQAESLLAALRLDPGQRRALELLPGLLTELERWEDLLEVLGLVREAATDDAVRAELSFQQGQAALRIESRSGPERLAAAAALAAGGQGAAPGGGPEVAAEHFLACLELRPEHVGALLGLARLRLEEERWSEAEELLARLLDPALAGQRADIPAHDWALRLAALRADHLGDEAGSRAALALALSIRPDSLEALTALGERAWAEERWEEAAELTARLQSLAAPEARPGLALRLGDIQLRLGQAEAARASFQQALSLDPAYRQAYERLEQLVTASGDASERGRFYLAWARGPAAGGSRAQLLATAARQLARGGEGRLAIEALQEAQALTPDDPALCESLVLLLGQEQRWPEMLAELARLCDATQDPARRRALTFEMGLVCKDHLGDREGAARAFEACLREEPGHAGALEELAEIRYQQRRWPEAEALYGALESGTPGVTRFLIAYRRGEMAEARGDHEAALQHYAACVEANPAFLHAHQCRVDLLGRLGRWAELIVAARALVERLADEGFEDLVADLWRRMARAQRALLQHEASAACYRELLNRAPDDLEAVLALRDFHTNQLHWRKAAEYAARALALRPLDPDTAVDWMALGEIQARKLEDLEAAQRSFENALRARPEPELALEAAWGLWKVLAGREQAEALCGLGPALLQHPLSDARRFVVARGLAAAWLATGRDPREALVAYQHALATGLADLELVDEAARLARELGEFGLYAALAGQALETRLGQGLDPEAALEGYLELARVYHEQQKDVGRAAACVRRALELHPRDPELLRRLGHLYASNFDTIQEAIDVFRELQGLDPADAECYRLLARLESARGDMDRAACYYGGLRFLAPMDQEVRRFLAYASPPQRPARAVAREEWDEVVLHPSADCLVQRVFAALAPYLERLFPPNPRRFTPDPQRPTDELEDALETARRLLGCRPFNLLVVREGSYQAWLDSGAQPTLALSRAVLDRSTPAELQFFVAREVAHIAMGCVLPRRFSRADLVQLLAILCKLAYPEAPELVSLPATATQYMEAIRRFTPPDTLREVEPLLRQFALEPRAHDLDRWLQGVRQTADRIGLMASGDLNAALAVQARFSPVAGGRELAFVSNRSDLLQGDQDMLGLLRFAFSEAHLKLRRALGVAILAPRSGEPARS